MMISKKISELNLKSENIVNAHVHLPLVNDNLMNALKSSQHSLLPPHLLEKTLNNIIPQHFLSLNNDIIGMNILLPIEIHNIFGNACPIYASNDYVLQLSKQYPNSFIPFGSIPMNRKNAPELIKMWHSKGIVGLKYHALEGYSLLDCDPTLATLESLDMPLVVHLGDTPFPNVNLDHARPSMLVPIFNKYPKLRIMLTHFGTPLHMEAFWVASRYENAFMDTAEYPIYWTAHPDNPYGPLLSPLHTKRVGVHKLVFGTDFPMPTLKDVNGKIELGIHDIGEYVEAILDLPEKYLSAEEKKQVFGENVWSFLGKQKKEIINRNRRIETI